MEIWGTLAAFASLLVFAVFLHEKYALKSAAPLASIALSTLYFLAAGAVGCLRAGGWLYFAVAAAVMVWLWLTRCRKGACLSFPGWGVWLFAAGGLCIIGLFALKQPLFTQWDEFSMWGTACKLTKQQDVLFTHAVTNWPWNQSQTPALSIFSYILQFFGAFAEWRAYAAYDLLILAAFAALLGPLERKDWPVAVPLTLCAFLAPYLLFHYYPVETFSTVYLSAYADIPLAVLWAAAVAGYFGAKPGEERSLLATAPALVLLTLTKEMGFALALITSVLIGADMLLTRARRTGAKGVRSFLGRPLFLLCCPPAAFLGWTYIAAKAPKVLHIQSTDVQSIGMLQMPFTGLAELFSPVKSEKFTAVMTRMTHEFWAVKDTMLGSGALVCALILFMLAFAALLSKEKKERIRIGVFGFLSVCGFGAYFLFLAFAYIYVFTDAEAYAIVGYERYIGAYLLGWFLCGIFFLGKAAGQRRWYGVGHWSLLALSAVFLLRVLMMVPLERSVVGTNDEMFSARRAFNTRVEQVARRLDPGDRVYIVSQDDDGVKWFLYSYEFLPVAVDYSFGGGPIDPDKEIPTRAMGSAFDLEEQAELAGQKLTIEVFSSYLAASDCDKMFIDHADEQFRRDYGALFSDGLQAYFDGRTDLYAIRLTDGGVQMTPVLE